MTPILHLPAYILIYAENARTVSLEYALALRYFGSSMKPN